MKLIDQKNWFAFVQVKIPILKALDEDYGFPLDIGAATITCGNRNFILDTASSDYNFEPEAGTDLEFTAKMFIDMDTFPKDKNPNYDLLVEDLNNKDVHALFFCSDQSIEEEDSFDYDAAEAFIIFRFGNAEEIKIKLELEV